MSVHSNLSFLHLLDSSLGVSLDDGTTDEEGIGDAPTSNLNNTDVVNIESLRVVRENVEASLGNQGREEVVVGVLLGSNRRLQATGDSINVVKIRNSLHNRI